MDRVALSWIGAILVDECSAGGSGSAAIYLPLQFRAGRRERCRWKRAALECLSRGCLALKRGRRSAAEDSRNRRSRMQLDEIRLHAPSHEGQTR